MMYRDDREEPLREVCALGNLKAVIQFAKAGVDVNSANPVNGWTALHWASYRGHGDVVEFLLRNGADPSLINKKGEAPAQLASNKRVRELLNVPSSDLEVSPVQQEPEFVPNYLSNPDLKKLWDLPDQDDLEARQPYPIASIPSSGKSDLTTKLENISLKAECSTFSERSVGREPDGYAQGPKEEILVCLDSEQPSEIIGAVYADCASTLSDLMEQIKKELTEAPQPFKLFKKNANGQLIPLHSGQFQLPWLNVVRPQAGDTLILRPVPNSP